jgi:NAD-dependent deacetylase
MVRVGGGSLGIPASYEAGAGGFPDGDDPRCTRCGGILKATTILFGERLDPAVLDRAERATLGCDLFLAVGSTLTVMPAAALCELAVESGAALVVVNRDPTPYDEMAEAVTRVPIGVAVP